MSITVKNQKVVWGQSAARCAMCKKPLIEVMSEGALEPLGEIAHIEGENAGSKRYNPNQTDQERNAPNNLLLLCPNDHTLIDRDEIEYTVEKLKKIKAEHLNFLAVSIKTELPNITFAELQVIVSYLVTSNSGFDQNDSLEHITPKEKIHKNDLSTENANLIAMGITRVKQVKDYLNTNPDVNFSERLRTHLSEYYNREKSEESDPNIIFSNMLDYMSGEPSNFKRKAGALAVITYFFETCDIFEK